MPLPRAVLTRIRPCPLIRVESAGGPPFPVIWMRNTRVLCSLPLGRPASRCRKCAKKFCPTSPQ
eukprot:10517330-Alexandrium_andersonii.AAC.1